MIIDDFSRFTWTRFLRMKDEVTEVLIALIKLIQNQLQIQRNNLMNDPTEDIPPQSDNDEEKEDTCREQFRGPGSPRVATGPAPAPPDWTEPKSDLYQQEKVENDPELDRYHY